MEFVNNVKPVWAHFYDKHRQPLVTVCYINDNDVGTGVGISICSQSDSPRKKVGRGISLTRARYALKKLSSAVNGSDADGIFFARSVVSRCEALGSLDSTDFRCGEGERALKRQGVYKILYVGKPGFRFSRRPSGPGKASDPTTPLPKIKKTVEKAGRS